MIRLHTHLHKIFLGFIISSLFFIITSRALAVGDLEVRIEFDDNIAEVWIEYIDDDGDRFDEKFTWTGMNDLDEVYEKIENQTDATAEEAEAAATVKADDSIYRGEAADHIKDATEVVDAAEEAYGEVSGSGLSDLIIRDARATLVEALRYLEEAEDGYAIEDFAYALAHAKKAEDAAEEVFDILDIDEDDYVNKTADEREANAIELVADARKEYFAANTAKNTARNKGAKVDEVIELLKEAFAFYDAANEYLQDENFSQASSKARDSMEKSEDAINAIPEIDETELEDEDRIELKDSNDDDNQEKESAKQHIRDAASWIDIADALIDDKKDTLDKDDLSDARGRISQANSKLKKANSFFADHDYEEAYTYSEQAIKKITGLSGVYDILDLAAPETLPRDTEDAEEETTNPPISEAARRADLQKQLNELLALIQQLIALKAQLEA